MTALYAHIEDGKVDYRGALPKNWRNVSGLSLCGDQDRDYLRSIGWCLLEVVEVEPGEHETRNGEHVNIEYAADGELGMVTITELVRPMTDAEIKDHDYTVWLLSMEKLDYEIPRWAEDLFDGMSNAARQRVAPETVAKMAAKKQLRASRPK